MATHGFGVIYPDGSVGGVPFCLLLTCHQSWNILLWTVLPLYLKQWPTISLAHKLWVFHLWIDSHLFIMLLISLFMMMEMAMHGELPLRRVPVPGVLTGPAHDPQMRNKYAAVDVMFGVTGLLPHTSLALQLALETLSAFPDYTPFDPAALDVAGVVSVASPPAAFPDFDFSDMEDSGAGDTAHVDDSTDTGHTALVVDAIDGSVSPIDSAYDALDFNSVSLRGSALARTQR
ncbi:unnamed protein product, partial [Prorocentrum cordatum]